MSSLVYMHLQTVPYAIFDMWFTKNNWLNESMQIINAEDCTTNTVNRWECIFLPLTNCSLDSARFVHCHGPSDLVGQAPCFKDDFFKVANIAENGGTYLSSGDSFNKLGVLPVTDHQKRVDDRYKELVRQNNGKIEALMKNTFINSLGITKQFAPDKVSVLVSHGLLFRPNFNLRSRIYVKLKDLAVTGDIPFHLGNAECVAVHIRRGDRSLKFDSDDGKGKKSTMNMREYCKLWLRNGNITRNSCTSQLLQDVKTESRTALGVPSCHRLLDLGCFGAHSFGELSLTDYLLKAKTLSPSISNAFVLSDDGLWLTDQVKKLPLSGTEVAHYKVGKLPAENEARIRTQFKSDGSKRNGTGYSVDFWASVAVARQCRSFVGHFGSAVSELVYEAMCFHHGKITGRCPHAADIGGTQAI